ncbi:uncharacterized protein IL334_000342 [Kwoniella shivajii]|uniref:Uncharacterized protein n=1 Tax=Kwoniella shivajii TaxID=564305 RepID=A0ABZ1CQ01_9TREE|nr:hypothetical protein IL334_000342 [Kwoniella shivajii]
MDSPPSYPSPPPYSLLGSNPSPIHIESPPIVNSMIDIPLLPTRVITPLEPISDFRTELNYRRALEDYQRQLSPSNWGKYRHGQLISLFNCEDEHTWQEWLKWFVEFMSSPEELVVHGRGRGVGIMGPHGAF